MGGNWITRSGKHKSTWLSQEVRRHVAKTKLDPLADCLKRQETKHLERAFSYPATYHWSIQQT